MKKMRLTEDPKTGLIVARENLTDEQKRERRHDNKLAKKSRALHRRRKPHGRS